MYERPRRGRDLRLLSICFVFLLAWAAIGYRLTIVQGARAEEFAERGLDQRLRIQTLAAHRGTIFDRDGQELALTVDAVTIVANPAEMSNHLEVARAIGPMVGRDVADLAAALSADTQFVYVARQVDENVAAAVRAANVTGIHFLSEPRRVYPLGALTAHIVGFVQSDDNRGLEGLELHYDEFLSGTPGQLLVERDPHGLPIPLGQYQVAPAEPGSDLVLTVKAEIQYAAQQALASAMARTGASSGSVIVLDPRTGEILAMVNMPTYDPNDRGTVTETSLRNRAITDVFEPGSTQKAVTIAAALETGTVSSGTVFEIPNTIELHDTVFRDVTPHSGTLSVTDIVTYSSNLGTILIGDQIGAHVLHSYLDGFGLGRPTGVDFPGEPSGLLRPPQEWCVTTCLASTAIGYRVSVTPLQMAMVYAAIANDGVWVQPHLVREIVDGAGARDALETSQRRVISEATARMMRLMMQAVVDSGTGTAAAVPGYRVGGKTGTTERYDFELQAYSQDHVVASFIGMAPVDDPRVVVAVVLDSPVDYASGGRGAAPVFAEVVLAALNQLGVPPDGR